MIHSFWRKIFLTGTMLWFPMAAFAYISQLTRIEVIPETNSTRIIFNFTQPTLYRLFSLQHTPRLVLDMQQTKLAVPLKSIHFSDPNIKLIRSGHPTPDTLRIVFDLTAMTKYQIIAETNRLTMEVAKLPEIAQPKKIVTTLPAISQPVKPKQVAVTVPQKMRKAIIVIDPGHGGKDPGAMGPTGIAEKNVVLAIGKRLAVLINQQPNMHAELTRNNDNFVTLRERLKLARDKKADYFMSIHADSFLDNHSSGVSIYALSKSGASSEAARWLAKRENNSELGGVDLSELNDQSYLLRSVLIDLSQTATITASLRLGTTLLDALNRVTRLHYPRIEQAPFVVLKSPDIPSVLVETGFISNPTEEIRLRSKKHQMILAQALFDGIQTYIKQYPPTSGG